MNKEAKIVLGITVVIIIAVVGIFIASSKNSGSTTTNSSGSTTVDASVLVRDDSHKKGAGAVTVVEFGDYQCPACGAAEPTLEQLESKYGDKITFVFRNFPLPQHANAKAAAEAAEAAGAQGKFWEMHDKLYATQAEWSDSKNPLDLFSQYASDLGLDVNKFKSDVSSNAYSSVVQQGLTDGATAGVQGTPTIYVNGVEAADYGVTTLTTVIDKALATAQ